MSRGALLKALAILTLLGGLAWAARMLPLEAWLHEGSRTIERLGPAGPVLYGLLYAVGVVAALPGSVLTLGAGLLFGPGWGFLVASFGSVAGAAGAFLVARYLARARVEALVRRNPRFAAIDRALGEEGWKIVALTRLSPVFPFNFLNYAYGVTRVGFLDYFLASWIAMAPATFLYVYVGSLGRVGAEALSGSETGTARLVLNVLGVAATAAVTVMVTRMARRALAEAEERALPAEAVSERS